MYDYIWPIVLILGLPLQWNVSILTFDKRCKYKVQINDF
jgi:hypothetical protein